LPKQLEPNLLRASLWPIPLSILYRVSGQTIYVFVLYLCGVFALKIETMNVELAGM